MDLTQLVQFHYIWMYKEKDSSMNTQNLYSMKKKKKQQLSYSINKEKNREYYYTTDAILKNML